MKIYKLVNYALLIFALAVFGHFCEAQSLSESQFSGPIDESDISVNEKETKTMRSSTKSKKGSEDEVAIRSEIVTVIDNNRTDADANENDSSGRNRNKEISDSKSKLPIELVSDVPKKAGKASYEPVKAKKAKRDEENCFTECLARYISPEYIVDCIGYCGTRQYVNCAICLGLAYYVVIGCATGCGLSD